MNTIDIDNLCSNVNKDNIFSCVLYDLQNVVGYTNRRLVVWVSCGGCCVGGKSLSQPSKTSSLFSTTDTNTILKIKAKIKARMRQQVCRARIFKQRSAFVRSKAS